MNKYQVLGVINALLSIFFIFVMCKEIIGIVEPLTLQSFIHHYSPNLILLISTGINLGLASLTLVKKSPKISHPVHAILTFSTIFWFLMLFVGYFVASSVLFPIVSLLLAVLIFYLVRKYSVKLAISLAVITLLVTAVVIAYGFEEDYCIGKGREADPTGSQMQTASQPDAVALLGFNVKAGDEIGVSFRAHMLCHNSFDLMKAMKEKYL